MHVGFVCVLRGVKVNQQIHGVLGTVGAKLVALRSVENRLALSLHPTSKYASLPIQGGVMQLV
jgi:hypothetical protein